MQHQSQVPAPLWKHKFVRSSVVHEISRNYRHAPQMTWRWGVFVGSSRRETRIIPWCRSFPDFNLVRPWLFCCHLLLFSAPLPAPGGNLKPPKPCSGVKWVKEMGHHPHGDTTTFSFLTLILTSHTLSIFSMRGSHLEPGWKNKKLRQTRDESHLLQFSPQYKWGVEETAAPLPEGSVFPSHAARIPSLLCPSFKGWTSFWGALTL